MASVLGIDDAPYAHTPLITTKRVLWGVWCLPADQVNPQLAASWKTKERAAQYLRWCLTSMWRCSVCQQSFQAHRPLTAPTFADQRALDLAAAQSDSARPPAAAGESAPPQGAAKGKRRAARDT
jgi:hypothetical protein